MFIVKIILSTFLIIQLISEGRAQNDTNTQQKRQTATQTFSPLDLEKEVVVAIEDEDKKQYLEQNFRSNAYEFGYEVGPNGQFHHENRGPDGVTYGCYGYVDPNEELMATHYIADGWGYRTVEPEKPVEIFREPHDETKFTSEEEHHHHGHITPWKELYFPRGCGRYPGGIKLKIATTKIQPFVQSQTGRPGDLNLLNQLDRVAGPQGRRPVGVQPQLIKPGGVPTSQFDRQPGGIPVGVQLQPVTPGFGQQTRRPTGTQPQVIQPGGISPGQFERQPGKSPVGVQLQPVTPGFGQQTRRPTGTQPQVIQPGSIFPGQFERQPGGTPVGVQPQSIAPGFTQARRPAGTQPQVVQPGGISPSQFDRQPGESPVAVQSQPVTPAFGQQVKRPTGAQPQLIQRGDVSPSPFDKESGRRLEGIQTQTVTPSAGRRPIGVQSQIIQPGAASPSQFDRQQGGRPIGGQPEIVTPGSIQQVGGRPTSAQTQTFQPGINPFSRVTIPQDGARPQVIQPETGSINLIDEGIGQQRRPIGVQPQIIQPGTFTGSQLDRQQSPIDSKSQPVTPGSVPQGRRPTGIQSEITPPGTTPLNRVAIPQGGIQPQVIQPGTVSISQLDGSGRRPAGIQSPGTISRGQLDSQQGGRPIDTQPQAAVPGAISSNQLEQLTIKQGGQPIGFQSQTPQPGLFEISTKYPNLSSPFDNVIIPQGRQPTGGLQSQTVRPGVFETSITQQGRKQTGAFGYTPVTQTIPSAQGQFNVQPDIGIQTGVGLRTQFDTQGKIQTSKQPIISTVKPQFEFTSQSTLDYRPDSRTGKPATVTGKPSLEFFGFKQQSITPGFPGISQVEISTEPIRVDQGQFGIKDFGVQKQQPFTGFTKSVTGKRPQIDSGVEFRQQSVTPGLKTQTQFPVISRIDSTTESIRLDQGQFGIKDFGVQGGIQKQQPFTGFTKSFGSQEKTIKPDLNTEKPGTIIGKRPQADLGLQLSGFKQQSITPGVKTQTQFSGISRIESSTEPVRLGQGQFGIKPFGVQGRVQEQQSFTEFTGKPVTETGKRPQITPGLQLSGFKQQSVTPAVKTQTQFPGIYRIEFSTEPIRLDQDQFGIKDFGVQGRVQEQQSFTGFTGKPFTVTGKRPQVTPGLQLSGFKQSSVVPGVKTQTQFPGITRIESSTESIRLDQGSKFGVQDFGVRGQIQGQGQFGIQDSGIHGGVQKQQPFTGFAKPFNVQEQDNLLRTNKPFESPSSIFHPEGVQLQLEGRGGGDDLDIPSIGSPELGFTSGFGGTEQSHVTPSVGISTTFKSTAFGTGSNIQSKTPTLGVVAQGREKPGSFEFGSFPKTQIGTQQTSTPTLGIQSEFITQRPEKVDGFGSTGRFDTSSLRQDSKVSTPFSTSGFQVGITRQGDQKINVFTTSPVVQPGVSIVQTGVTGEPEKKSQGFGISSSTPRTETPFGFTIQQKPQQKTIVQTNIPTKVSTVGGTNQLTGFGVTKTSSLEGQLKLQPTTPTTPYSVTPGFVEQRKQERVDFRGQTRFQSPQTPQFEIQTVQKTGISSQDLGKIPTTTPGTIYQQGFRTNASGQIDYSRFSVSKQYPKPFSTQFGKGTEDYSFTKQQQGDLDKTFRGTARFTTKKYEPFGEVKTTTELPGIPSAIGRDFGSQPPSSHYFTQQVSSKAPPFATGQGRPSFQAAGFGVESTTKSTIPTDRGQQVIFGGEKSSQFDQKTKVQTQGQQRQQEFSGQVGITDLGQKQIDQIGFTGSISPRPGFEDGAYQRIPVTKKPDQINVSQGRLFTSKPAPIQPRPFKEKEYPQFPSAPGQIFPGDVTYSKTQIYSGENEQITPEGRSRPSSVGQVSYTGKEQPSPFSFGKQSKQPQRPAPGEYEFTSRTGDLELKTPATQPRLEFPKLFEQNVISTTPSKFDGFVQRIDLKQKQPALGEDVPPRDQKTEIQSNVRQFPARPSSGFTQPESPGLNCLYNNYPVGNCQPGIQAIDALGVQPPARVRTNIDYINGGVQRPVLFVIPYPLPIGPNPATCPCYLVEPGTNTTDTIDNQKQNIPINPLNITSVSPQQFANFTTPPVGIIGFIPVVFFPYCPDNNTNTDMIKPVFPSAVPIPYPCSVCNPDQQNRNLYDNTFQQILLQSQSPNNFLVLSPHRRRLRKIKRT